jgi:hypothetical protein
LEIWSQVGQEASLRQPWQVAQASEKEKKKVKESKKDLLVGLVVIGLPFFAIGIAILLYYAFS